MAARILPASHVFVQNVRMWNSIRWLRPTLVGASLLLAACSQHVPSWREGELLVIVPDVSRGAEAEFERDLATLFGEQLHITVRLIPATSDKVEQSLQNHRAHFAAASLRSGISVTAPHFGPSYQTVREQLICNRDHKVPHALADLQNMNLAVPANSAQEAALKEAQTSFPNLKWLSQRGSSIEDLLREVAGGNLDCTVANENSYAGARNYYSNLVAAFDIGSPSRLAWAFPRDVDPELLEEARRFFARIEQDGTLNRLLERYYGHNNRLKPLDAASFIERTNKILPDYRPLFEEAASLTGMDWRLLAAVAYQESQWDPLATSFTNVRGMMMLTEETADRMKVGNRLDARESIIAGAKYLLLLKEQMPDRIPEPDRTWLALAAYNQGYGHLEDARILTQRAGMNSDSWADVKKWMPLLNRPGYYEALKHGYARGGEAVILVESIRSYYDMLKRLEPDESTVDSSEISYRLIEPLKLLLR
jgi:membrane-bound lytic murein transglycosylase F